MNTFWHTLILLNIYLLLTLGTYLFVGLTNYISLNQAVFFGIGAYITGSLIKTYDASLGFIVISVIIASALGGIGMAISTRKLTGDYFVLATISLQLIAFTCVYNLNEIAGGSYGLSFTPGIRLASSVRIEGAKNLALASSVVTIASISMVRAWEKSPFGRILKAMKEGEYVLRSLGRSVETFRLWGMLLSAVLCGLGGMVFASHYGYIHPESFNLDESFLILSALFIGGSRKWTGPVIGAFFIVLLPLALRNVGLKDPFIGNAQQMLYGLALILILHFRYRKTTHTEQNLHA